MSYSHINLAALQLESGRGINQATLAHVAEATRLMETVVASRPGDKAVADGYATTLAWAADAEYQACNLGNTESANRYLQAVIQLQLSSSEPPSGDISDTQRLVKARYQWWELNGTNNFERFPMMPDFDQNSTSEFRSCTEADSAARMYVIANDRDNAASEVAYLQARGYADPKFIRFCERHDLCEG